MNFYVPRLIFLENRVYQLKMRCAEHVVVGGDAAGAPVRSVPRRPANADRLPAEHGPARAEPLDRDLQAGSRTERTERRGGKSHVGSRAGESRVRSLSASGGAALRARARRRRADVERPSRRHSDRADAAAHSATHRDERAPAHDARVLSRVRVHRPSILIAIIR